MGYLHENIEGLSIFLSLNSILAWHGMASALVTRSTSSRWPCFFGIHWMLLMILDVFVPLRFCVVFAQRQSMPYLVAGSRIKRDIPPTRNLHCCAFFTAPKLIGFHNSSTVFSSRQHFKFLQPHQDSASLITNRNPRHRKQVECPRHDDMFGNRFPMLAVLLGIT